MTGLLWAIWNMFSVVVPAVVLVVPLFIYLDATRRGIGGGAAFGWALLGTLLNVLALAAYLVMRPQLMRSGGSYAGSFRRVLVVFLLVAVNPAVLWESYKNYHHVNALFEPPARHAATSESPFFSR